MPILSGKAFPARVPPANVVRHPQSAVLFTKQAPRIPADLASGPGRDQSLEVQFHRCRFVHFNVVRRRPSGPSHCPVQTVWRGGWLEMGRRPREIKTIPVNWRRKTAPTPSPLSSSGNIHATNPESGLKSETINVCVPVRWKTAAAGTPALNHSLSFIGRFARNAGIRYGDIRTMRPGAEITRI